MGAAPSLWLGALGRLAGRAAHELKNPLNGLALNLEVVRSRSARAGTDGSALAPYAAAAASELERSIPLVEALLALARPLPNPVDLRSAIQPLLVLYRAIAMAGGGTLDVVYEAEQVFVSADGDTVRALVAEALDVTVGANLEVAGRVGDSDGSIAIRLVGGAGRPVATRMEALAVEHDIRLNSDEDETLLLFPALTRAGVDSAR
ncbi:MAG TPA: histidine kinase dimerization/phospho-acceptor domain-containing protein [Gemmatimonadaceae bacterium]|nr:histidine kinase dimerization/phospho-acceptor domain-containing protein [Gemmatimonadaceae bacterium]